MFCQIWGLWYENAFQNVILVCFVWFRDWNFAKAYKQQFVIIKIIIGFNPFVKCYGMMMISTSVHIVYGKQSLRINTKKKDDDILKWCAMCIRAGCLEEIFLKKSNPSKGALHRWRAKSRPTNYFIFRILLDFFLVLFLKSNVKYYLWYFCFVSLVLKQHLIF